ncbi:MAG: aminoacyl-tRNA hydrolase [Candidatus Rokuibacteriota bacterium]|nr:MAG: aminoacyl-tRNA hydrolase [Candidatus Rokubacteria bacterium]
MRFPRRESSLTEPIAVTGDVRVPGRAILVRAVRASGHGGQNVNKVSTKIELHVDTDAIEGLPVAARLRLAALTRRRRDAEGRLLVTSQQSRHQGQNLDDARDKVRAIILASLAHPTPRRPTRPSSAAEERRIREKKRRAETKRWRAAGAE